MIKDAHKQQYCYIQYNFIFDRYHKCYYQLPVGEIEITGIFQAFCKAYELYKKKNNGQFK